MGQYFLSITDSLRKILMTNIFTYGTLMFPEVAGRVAEIYTPGEPLTVLGFQRFAVRIRERGNFPAVRPVPSASVTGLLYRNLTSQQVDWLDYFECVADGLYSRETATGELRGEPIEFQLF